MLYFVQYCLQQGRSYLFSSPETQMGIVFASPIVLHETDHAVLSSHRPKDIPESDPRTASRLPLCVKHFPGKVFRCENGVLQEDVSFSENQAAMTTIISENSVIDIESPTEEIEEPTVVHEVISLNEDPEILSHTEPTLQEGQEVTLVTEDSEITDSTTVLIEEKITEEPRDASEENVLSGNDETKKKDDSGPDIVGFELI